MSKFQLKPHQSIPTIWHDDIDPFFELHACARLIPPHAPRRALFDNRDLHDLRPALRGYCPFFGLEPSLRLPWGGLHT